MENSGANQQDYKQQRNITVRNRHQARQQKNGHLMRQKAMKFSAHDYDNIGEPYLLARLDAFIGHYRNDFLGSLGEDCWKRKGPQFGGYGSFLPVTFWPSRTAVNNPASTQNCRVHESNLPRSINAALPGKNLSFSGINLSTQEIGSQIFASTKDTLDKTQMTSTEVEDHLHFRPKLTIQSFNTCPLSPIPKRDSITEESKGAGYAQDLRICSIAEPVPLVSWDNWVQCDGCKQWRLLPLGVNPDSLIENWFCSMQNWLPPAMSNCDIPEEETQLAFHKLYGVSQSHVQTDEAPADAQLPASVISNHLPAVKSTKQVPQEDILQTPSKIGPIKKGVIQRSRPYVSVKGKSSRSLLENDEQYPVNPVKITKDNRAFSQFENERKVNGAIKQKILVNEKVKPKAPSKIGPIKKGVVQRSSPYVSVKGKSSRSLVENDEQYPVNPVKMAKDGRAFPQFENERKVNGAIKQYIPVKEKVKQAPSKIGPIKKGVVQRSRPYVSVKGKSSRCLVENDEQYPVNPVKMAKDGRAFSQCENERKVNGAIKQKIPVKEKVKPKQIPRAQGNLSLQLPAPILNGSVGHELDLATVGWGKEHWLHSAKAAFQQGRDLAVKADQIKNNGGAESDVVGVYFYASLRLLDCASILELSTADSARNRLKESLALYEYSARLSEECAKTYEGNKKWAAATLAYYCGGSAHMCIVKAKTANINRDRQEIRLAVQLLSSGESPYSSISDVNNLNNHALTQGNCSMNPEKGVGSLHASRNYLTDQQHFPPDNHLLQYVENTAIGIENLSKAQIAFHAFKISSCEENEIDAVRGAIDFNCYNIDGLLRLVHLAMDAIDY